MRHATLLVRIEHIWLLLQILKWRVLDECLRLLEQMHGEREALCATNPETEHASIRAMYDQMGDQIAIAVMSDLNRFMTGVEIHADPREAEQGLDALMLHFAQYGGATQYRQEVLLAQARLTEELGT